MCPRPPRGLATPGFLVYADVMPYVIIPVLDQSGNPYNMRAFANPDGTLAMVSEIALTRPSLSEGFKTLPVAANTLPAAPNGSTMVAIQVQGGDIRFGCIGGVTASATTGMIAREDEVIYLNATEASVFTAFTLSGTPKLWVVWS